MKKATFYVFLSSVLFALGGLFFKLIPWDALAISSARSILAGALILICLLLKRHRFAVNRQVLIAALSISATNTLYAMANKLTTAGNTIVLQFSMPVFVILIMLLVFHKRPTKLEVTTCALVLAGVVCFFVDSLSAGNLLGNLLALISGMTYACFFVFNSRADSEPFTAIVLSYLISALIGLPSLLHTDIGAASWGTLLAVLALGFIQQGVAQMCFAAGIKHVSPVTASLISGIEPILNPVLVAVFYHEMLTPLSLVGAAVVLISILVYNTITSKAKTEA